MSILTHERSFFVHQIINVFVSPYKKFVFDQIHDKVYFFPGCPSAIFIPLVTGRDAIYLKLQYDCIVLIYYINI